MGMVVKLVVFVLAIAAVLGIVDYFGWYDIPYICVKGQAACATAAEAVVDAVS